MSALKYWIWLSTAPVLSRVKGALLNFYGDPENAFNAPGGEFATIPGINKEAAGLLEKHDDSEVNRVIDMCQKQGLDIITLEDPRYPSRLKNVYAPPCVLYVKGKLPAIDENPVIAVVGTRKASQYGLRMSTGISSEIVRFGGIVASGLTYGIDAAAAEGALRAGGTCIGVLGTPHEMDKNYLTSDVARNGAVISEYAPMTECQRGFFRERNRITAGISVGVVAVEAPEKSGTRLFVDEAIDQGKEIFAVPGNADEDNSVGTISMLKDGAKLVTSGRDVMSEFEWMFPDKISLPLDDAFEVFPRRDGNDVSPQMLRCAAPKRPYEAKPRKSGEEKAIKKEVDNKKDTGYIEFNERIKGLTDDQLKIVLAIEDGAALVDEIVEATGLSTPVVLSQLTILEIKSIVKRGAGKRMALNK